MNILNKKTCRFMRLLVAVLILAMLSACSGVYGTYRADANAAKVFKSMGAIDDYDYYYTGSNVHPAAILAIHKSYTLTSADLWNKMDITGKNRYTRIGATGKGFAYTLMTPDGKEIGFLFTAWNPGPLLMEGEKRVSVYLPEPDLNVGVSKE